MGSAEREGDGRRIPIFNDFNPYVYSRGYELAVVLFPIATLLIFHGLTWLGPRVGLVTPPSRGALRPLRRDPHATEPTEPDRSSEIGRRLGIPLRVAAVGAVLGLEAAVAVDHLWPTVALTAIGYGALMAAAAALVSPFYPARRRFDLALASANAVGTTLTVVGLTIVSAHTALTVVAGDVRHPYPWFPVWVGVPIAVVMAVGIIVALRRSGPAGAVRVERWAVIIIAGSVALFVLSARLPGDLGQIGLFEEGQQVTEAMLIGHGWLPWRDVFLAHGLLGDIAPVTTGWGLFGNSYWGAAAGFSFIWYPLAAVSTYLLMCYLVRRSWPLLLIAGLIFVGSWFGAVVDPAYAAWPIVLLLLAMLLRRRARSRAIALGVLVVAQAIASDEMAPCVVIVLAGGRRL